MSVAHFEGADLRRVLADDDTQFEFSAFDGAQLEGQLQDLSGEFVGKPEHISTAGDVPPLAGVPGGDFTDAKLDPAALGARLHGAPLAGANFERANLAGVNLADADLRGARFHDTDLRDADLSGAQLDGCFLDAMYLKGVNLSSASLRGARAKRLAGANVGL